MAISRRAFFGIAAVAPTAIAEGRPSRIDINVRPFDVGGIVDNLRATAARLEERYLGLPCIRHATMEELNLMKADDMSRRRIIETHESILDLASKIDLTVTPSKKRSAA